MSQLYPGWQQPVFDAQSVFRSSMLAQSYVGRAQQIEPELELPPGIEPACAALALTLIDFETPVCCLGFAPQVLSWLQFHTQAPQVELAEAHFVLVAKQHELPSLHQCLQGTDLYPDRSATIIKELSNLNSGQALCLSGPGLAQPMRLHLPDLPADFVRQRMANYLHFPCGVDLFLCAGRQLLALPRSTKVEEA